VALQVESAEYLEGLGMLACSRPRTTRVRGQLPLSDQRACRLGPACSHRPHCFPLFPCSPLFLDSDSGFTTTATATAAHSTLIHFSLSPVYPEKTHNTFHTNSSANIRTELARYAFHCLPCRFSFSVARLKRILGSSCAFLGRRRKQLN
jgi:hypothetical protein